MASVVQHTSVTASVTSGSVLAATLTFGASITPGNTVVVLGAYCSGGMAADSVTITTNGNADNWTGAFADYFGNVASLLGYDPDSIGGTTAVDVSIALASAASTSDSAEVLLDCYEIGGLGPTPVLQVYTNDSSSSAGTSWSSGSTPGNPLGAVQGIFLGNTVLYVSAANTATTVMGPSSPWTNETLLSGSIQDGGTGTADKHDIYELSGYQAWTGQPGSLVYSGTNGTSSYYAAWGISLSPPPPPPPPRKPAKGRPAAVKGSSRSSPGAHYVNFPSAFTLPTKAAKGRQAAVKGTSRSSPGAAYVDFPSVLILPTRPAKGAQAAVRGSSRSSPGAKYIHVIPPGPSPFTLPTGPAKGRSAAVRGHSTSSPGARFVLIRISPFTLPKAPARGRAAIQRGKSSAGSATGQGAPWVPRALIIAIASAAGTDDYGNAFPQGIAIGAAIGPQVKLGLNATGAGIVKLDLNDAAFQPGEINSEAIGSPLYGSMGVIGPASTAAGHTDYVEEAFNSANSAGTSSANWQIFYVDTTGVANLVATADANGFTFNRPVTADGTATFNGAVVIGGYDISSQPTPSITTVPHNPNDPLYGGAGGTAWVSGERAVLDGQIDDINANFSAIVAALQAAGIWH